MVIGNGMMAKAFSQYQGRKDVLIFASGVSNSSEIRAECFRREYDSLKNALHTYRELLVIYFSTCSILDPDLFMTPYVQHKLNMEKTIRELHSQYLIFRLPQVVGTLGNRMTLINYLYDKIMTGEVFQVWGNARRYVIDADDVASIATYIIDNKTIMNSTVNVASHPYGIFDIIIEIEKITGKKARYVTVDKGGTYELDCSAIQPVLTQLGIEFSDGYLDRILHKYIPPRAD